MPNAVTDTLSTLQAGQAFISGSLDLPTVGAEGRDVAPLLWNDVTVNGILVTISAVLLLLMMRQLVSIFPELLRGVFSNRAAVTFENSMRNLRDRNTVAWMMVLPFCLLLSRYSVYAPAYISHAGRSVQVLLVICTVAGYAAIRAALCSLIPIKGQARSVSGAANRSLYNFFILFMVTGLAEAAILYIFGANDLTVRKFIIATMILTFFLFCWRKTSLLLENCSHLAAFLYLCTLELFPAALPVVAALVF